MLNIEKIYKDLRAMGFQCEEGTAESSEPSITAVYQTGRGPLEIFAIRAGARFAKPNGTAKYYYKISDAQLIAAARRTIKANG